MRRSTEHRNHDNNVRSTIFSSVGRAASVERKVRGFKSVFSHPLFLPLFTHTVYSSSSLTWPRLHLYILKNNQHAIPNQFHQFYQQETQKRKQPSETCPGTCPGTGDSRQPGQVVNSTDTSAQATAQMQYPGIVPGDSGQARTFPESGAVPHRWTSDCGTVSSTPVQVDL